MPADDADDGKQRDSDEASPEESPSSHQKFDPPTESKYKIPIASRRPARGPSEAEREALVKACTSRADAPPSQRATLRTAPEPRGPTRNALYLLGVVVALVTFLAVWGTWRESKPMKPAGAATPSTPATPAPAIILTTQSTTAVTPHPPAQLPATTTACRCVNDFSLNSTLRAKCVEELRDDESLEAETCLRRFIDENAKSLDKTKSKDPTPDQKVILDAVNAMYAKANPGLPKVSKPKPPAVGPNDPPRLP